MKIACITIIVVVLVTAVASGQIVSSSIKGFTEPCRSIDIAAAEVGTIAAIAVQSGDHVQADTILARLNENVLTALLHMQQNRFRKIAGVFER